MSNFSQKKSPLFYERGKMNSGLGLPFSGSYWTAVALFGCSEEGLIFRDILRASALIGVLGTAVAHATPVTAKCAVVSACICD
ncbi:hypothetical protein KBB41_03280, partial [Candidatus Curtissbacteria bacterium]|nr:hypothetical protein [Candidatus Curtissbacteria bacterium]